MIDLSGGRLESISNAGGGANRTCYSMDRPLFRLLVTSTVEPLPNFAESAALHLSQRVYQRPYRLIQCAQAKG